MAEVRQMWSWVTTVMCWPVWCFSNCIWATFNCDSKVVCSKLCFPDVFGEKGRRVADGHTQILKNDAFIQPFSGFNLCYENGEEKLSAQTRGFFHDIKSSFIRWSYVEQNTYSNIRLYVTWTLLHWCFIPTVYTYVDAYTVYIYRYRYTFKWTRYVVPNGFSCSVSLCMLFMKECSFEHLSS